MKKKQWHFWLLLSSHFQQMAKRNNNWEIKLSRLKKFPLVFHFSLPLSPLVQPRRVMPCTSRCRTVPWTTRSPTWCVGPRRIARCCRGSAKRGTCWGKSCTGEYVWGEEAEEAEDRMQWDATTPLSHRGSVQPKNFSTCLSLIKCKDLTWCDLLDK